MQRSRRAIQEEGRATTKALRWEGNWAVRETKRRPVLLEHGEKG